MSINDLKLYGEEYTQPLINLYNKTGNSSLSGYLGEELKDVLFDGDGKLHFSTDKKVEDIEINSHGVVLTDSVLIKQVQKGRYNSSYRLYSWDVDDSKYTFISFDNNMALNRYYDTVQRFDVSLCGEDISSLFQEMGLSFESVSQIILNQTMNPMDVLFEQEVEEESKPYGI